MLLIIFFLSNCEVQTSRSIGALMAARNTTIFLETKIVYEVFMVMSNARGKCQI